MSATSEKAPVDAPCLRPSAAAAANAPNAMTLTTAKLNAEETMELPSVTKKKATPTASSVRPAVSTDSSQPKGSGNRKPRNDSTNTKSPNEKAQMNAAAMTPMSAGRARPRRADSAGSSDGTGKSDS